MVSWRFKLCLALDRKMTLAIFLALKAGLVFFKKAFCFSLKPRHFLMWQKLCHGLTSSQFTYMYVQAICKLSDFLYLKQSSNCVAPIDKTNSSRR